MEQDITNHLRDLFNPTAIILHGSRAVGRERPHSDWDIFLLYKVDEELPKNGRLIWREQNIEHSHHHFPTEDIEKEFGVKLQFGRVIYENETVGSDLLEEAKAVYEKPAGWSEEDNDNHKLWMQGRVGGMKDTVNQPLVFERYASDFYSRVTNYWYWSIQDTFPKPIYFALEEIKEKDQEFFSLIERFVKEVDRNKRVVTAEEIMERCFG